MKWAELDHTSARRLTDDGSAKKPIGTRCDRFRERCFISIRDVDNNRGGAQNCYQTPPCKQRGGGEAGTGEVKYEN